MGSAAVLAAACARARLRSRGTAAFLVLGPAALAWAVFSGRGVAGGAPAVEAALLCAFLLAAAVAAASGADLPLARASGHGEWFATLAPSAVARRTAPIVAGVALTVAAGIAASLVAALLLVAAGRTVPTHAFVRASLAPGPNVVSSAVPATLTLPEGARGALEIDLRPRWRDPAASAIATVPLRVAFEGGAARTGDAPVRGTLSLPLPAGEHPRSVSLSLVDDARVRLLVVGARVRGEERSFALAVVLAGLLAALAAACVVPAVVLCSRATSVPTALAAGVVLLLVGVAHADLLSWASDLESSGGGALAGGVLRAAAAVAPDLSAVSALSEVAAGRGIDAQAFAALLPAAANAGVATLLAALLPGRGRTAP